MQNVFSETRVKPPEETVVIKAAEKNSVKVFFPDSLGVPPGIAETLLDVIRVHLGKKGIKARIKEAIPETHNNIPGATYEIEAKEPAIPDLVKIMLDTTGASVNRFIKYFIERRSEDASHNLAIIRRMEKEQESIVIEEQNGLPTGFKISFFRCDKNASIEFIRLVRSALQVRGITCPAAEPAESYGATAAYVVTGMKLAEEKIYGDGGLLINCSGEMNEVIQQINRQFSAVQDEDRLELLRTMRRKSDHLLSTKPFITESIAHKLGIIERDGEKFWQEKDIAAVAAELTLAVLKGLQASAFQKVKDNNVIEVGRAICGVLKITYHLPPEAVAAVGGKLMATLQDTIAMYGREQLTR